MYFSITQVLSNFDLENRKIIIMDRISFFFGLKATKTSDPVIKPLSTTAIIYRSKEETTQKVALLIKELLMDENITLIDLDKQERVDLTWCERIIIGGSIHKKQVPKPVHVFCQQYAGVLKSKKLGLFLCCRYKGEKAIEQFNNAFPEDILAAAQCKAILGYELNYEKMNFIDRALTRKVTRRTESMCHINQQELNRFIEELRNLVYPSTNYQTV